MYGSNFQHTENFIRLYDGKDKYWEGNPTKPLHTPNRQACE